ncbi:hypothetical protein [Micromonospora sp. NPDC005172]|uniref:hypothetical protein n=1 Tax=Micromonospora sp. NPDC005172 TaxID=3156867 RepID=UPI0033A4043E
MTHPQPPVGPQDPQQPSPEPPPTQPFPATPQPQQSAADPTVPQAPVPPDPWSAAAQTPVSGQPAAGVSPQGVPEQWAAPTNAPLPPFASSPYPVSPDQPWPQPPFSGSAYPYAGGAYPPPGGPGYPPTTPPVATKSSKKTVVVVAVTAAVLTLLCCAGGIVAVVFGANRAANEVTDALPTPGVTRGVGQPPATAAPSPRAADGGDTRDMSVGDTLVLDDSSGTVEITVTKFSTSAKPCTSYGLEPDEGMYVIADVTVAVTRGTGSANPLYFQWVAADGTETNAIAGAFSGCGKPIPAGNDLTAGTRRTGSVVFDVHDRSGVLEYQPRFATAGSWKP